MADNTDSLQVLLLALHAYTLLNLCHTVLNNVISREGQKVKIETIKTTEHFIRVFMHKSWRLE